jgi:Spy/CpxP family protein refolding chaperone
MRTVLTALSGAALAMALSIPAAAAASPAPQPPARPHYVQSHDDGGENDHYYDHDYYCHGLITRLLCWLV